MSKKHYIEVAAIIKSTNDEHGITPSVSDVAYELASFFKRDNPQFDRERFLAAAGLEV